jgi:hypothetical protein
MLEQGSRRAFPDIAKRNGVTGCPYKNGVYPVHTVFG